ncbi:hypothetical protein C8J57DRAFT_1528105 [Mycena rebaudengoi]|nr:hypothetical protein C8J57DRAFT_1528105 [Mycena rebaudengoi]
MHSGTCRASRSVGNGHQSFGKHRAPWSPTIFHVTHVTLHAARRLLFDSASAVALDFALPPPDPITLDFVLAVAPDFASLLSALPGPSLDLASALSACLPASARHRHSFAPIPSHPPTNLSAWKILSLSLNCLMGRKRSSKSLSGGHRVSYGAAPANSISLNKTAAQLKHKKDQFRDQVAALSFLQREELFGEGPYDLPMDDGLLQYSANDSDTDNDNASIDTDEAEAFQRLPAGDEGMLHSPAGKEAIFEKIWRKCKPGRGDPRRRAMRVQKMVDAWRAQMPALVDAYLLMRKDGPLNSENTPGAWEIQVVGFDEHGSRRFVHLSDACETNQSLMRHGYIGASPDKVSLAFPICTLEIFRQIHRTCPRYSLDALSKTLMNIHHVPHRSTLAEQLSTVYDAFLEVLWQVDSRVHTALGHDATWFTKNICPPCLYKTENEDQLKFSFLSAMDGNNSLKLFDSALHSGDVRPDDRILTSFRWLTPAQVDVFKDEVMNSQKKARQRGKKAPEPQRPPVLNDTTPPPIEPDIELPDVGSDQPSAADPSENDSDIAWLNVNELSASETDGLVKALDTCVERWKAAGPEGRKKMFALFAVAGVFLSVCRHGHLLIMCDMIRSGELMKYPLAIVKHLLDSYGADIGLGYDIMCQFFKTLCRSSLGAQTVALCLRGVVPAFHGHAHNRPCQLGWHPLYIEGVGLEDFEECERTFSKSNHLASTTRSQTVFHRRQQLDEHFQFHDQDKHAVSGNFIFQNYMQALEKIATNRRQLSALEERLGTTAEDYEAAHAAEVKYFQYLRSEPEEIQQSCDYIELLLKLQKAKLDADHAKLEYTNRDYLIIKQGYTRTAILKLETRYRTTWTKYVTTQETVCRFEEQHSIAERWTSSSEEFKSAIGLLSERKYRLALNEIERLVVAWLLELTKLNMGGVVYNLRDKISKAFKTRAEAIRHALAAYNEAASALNPPRERLQWADVINATSLAEFDLLRDTRNNVREQPWAQPARREAMILYFGIKRAQEEIRRLNMEIRRLITYMLDEHVDYHQAIASNLIVNSPLAAELSERWHHACRISTSICIRLDYGKAEIPSLGLLFDLLDGWGGILGIAQTEVEYDEPELEAECEPDELDDGNLVVRELDVDEDHLADLMEHLGSFEDS